MQPLCTQLAHEGIFMVDKFRQVTSLYRFFTVFKAIRKGHMKPEAYKHRRFNHATFI